MNASVSKEKGLKITGFLFLNLGKKKTKQMVGKTLSRSQNLCLTQHITETL